MVSTASAQRKAISRLQATIRRPGTRFAGIQKFRQGIGEKNFFSAYKELFPLKISLQDYHGPSFPRSAKQLLSNRVPKTRVTAYREILWAIARCLQQTQSLRAFVKLKEEYEVFILQNNHAAAHQKLNDVEAEFGKSIWLYRNRLSCAHISPNESNPSEVALAIQDEVKDNRILHPLIHFIRRGIESATLREELREEFTKLGSSIFEEYLLVKILDTTDSSEDSVSSLLFIDSQSSLLDHYTSLILALQAAVSDDMFTAEMAGNIAPAICTLFRTVDDRRLSGILTALGYPTAITEKDSEFRVQAIEAYTIGEYESCMDFSKKALIAQPLDSAIRLIYVKSAVALMSVLPKETGVCGDINNHLYNILSANDQFFSSVHALLVLADRFNDHQWMLYLRVAVWYEIGAEDVRRTQRWMRDMFVRDSFISPLMALALSETASTKIIAYLTREGIYPKTLSLVQRTLACADIAPDLLSAREAKYQARELLARKDYKLSAKFYLLAADREKRAAIKLRVLGGAALALALDGQYGLAVDTLVNAYLEIPHAPILLPFNELVQKLDDPQKWPNTISLGILFSLASQLDEDQNISKLRLCFETFCENNSIFTPAELYDRIEEYGVTQTVAYLDSVWQPEVMRQTLLYTHTQQIEEARIEACQILAKIDKPRSRLHKEELASRIKQQEITKATALVEQSRVYVDIEAIKRALKTRLKSSYAQYKNSLSQHGKPQNPLIKRVQNALQDLEATTSLPTLLSTIYVIDGRESPTQADIQFNALFSEITREFLTGDHGLNAYLSTRVRHGKFVDALRKSVMDEHLVTTRSEDGTYTLNTYWTQYLRTFGYEDRILSLLRDFSRRFDDVLFHVRDERIQIQIYSDFKTAELHGYGLFRYHFSYLERQLMQSYDVDFKDFDELILKCVDTLWEKTDINLSGVREYLSGNLRDNIINLFEELIAEISRTCGDTSPSVLANAIARARTATQQALDKVVTWFHRSEVYDRPDFEIDFASQIAASMVNRTLSIPDNWQGPACHIESADSRLPGRSLDSLVDIFYALFENCAKYSDAEKIPLNVRLNLRYQEGEFDAEIVSIALPPSEADLRDLDALRTSLLSQESKRLAQSEGRSGFRKIQLALSSPIYKAPRLEFAHEQEGLFRVKFGFRIAEQI